MDTPTLLAWQLILFWPTQLFTTIYWPCCKSLKWAVGIYKGLSPSQSTAFACNIDELQGRGGICLERRWVFGGGTSHTRHCHRTGSHLFVGCPFCLHCDDLVRICLNVCLRNQGLVGRGELLPTRLNKGMGETLKANSFWFQVFEESILSFIFPDTSYYLLL